MQSSLLKSTVVLLSLATTVTSHRYKVAFTPDSTDDENQSGILKASFDRTRDKYAARRIKGLGKDPGMTRSKFDGREFMSQPYAEMLGKMFGYEGCYITDEDSTDNFGTTDVWTLHKGLPHLPDKSGIERWIMRRVNPEGRLSDHESGLPPLAPHWQKAGIIQPIGDGCEFIDYYHKFTPKDVDELEDAELIKEPKLHMNKQGWYQLSHDGDAPLYEYLENQPQITFSKSKDYWNNVNALGAKTDSRRYLLERLIRESERCINSP